MSGAIAVFVKTPGLSPVKTRLAATLSQKIAEIFHLASARSVASVIKELSKQADIKSYYAVAEKVAESHTYWQDLPCIWQGEGGLGKRMSHIYHTLLKQHDFVILVGADIPQMTVKVLLSIPVWLNHQEQARLAFAPSDDGGFWMVAGNCNIPEKIWTDVVYSKPDTGILFFNKIEKLGDIKTIDCLRDIDEVQDLVLLKDIMTNLTEPTNEQNNLIQFLDTLPLNRYKTKNA